MSTVEGKSRKARGLLDAAYELFLERGRQDQRGGYHQPCQGGKGTFYLYFQDKGR